MEQSGSQADPLAPPGPHALPAGMHPPVGHCTCLDSCKVEAHRAFPDPVGRMPMGVEITLLQSSRSIRPFTTYRPSTTHTCTTARVLHHSTDWRQSRTTYTGTHDGTVAGSASWATHACTHAHHTCTISYKHNILIPSWLLWPD